MLYFWANRSRLSIFTIANFVYLYSPTTCKISEKSLIWIPITRCLRSFWPLGIKISHLEAKKSFLIIFTILASTIHRKSHVKSHVIHYFHLSFCKNSKKPLEWIPRKRKQAFWAQIDPWSMSGHWKFFPKSEIRHFFSKLFCATVCKVSKILLLY